MQFDAHCMECFIRKHHELVQPKDDGPKACQYLRDIMQIMLDAPAGVSPPWLTDQCAKAYAKYWPGEDAYAQLKKDSNDLILELLPQVRPMVEQAGDPLAMAMKFARTGNFLDFGILTPEVAHKALWDAVEQTPAMELDPDVYQKLLTDLEAAKLLVILGDNAGEIAFDTLLVEQLKKRYPALDIRYCVRGANALNDATRADAHYVGMDKLVPILDNGSGISGTELDYIPAELRKILQEADVILSKGSGNLESLAGCGLNIYYIFMCKCPRVAKLLGCENMTGQFLRERELPEMNPMVGAL